MPDNDSISYFSSLGYARTGEVRVTPTAKSAQAKPPASNDSAAVRSPSGTDGDSDQTSRSLRADRLTLSKQAESLSTDDLRLIQKLAQRDREVRAHEAAHLGAAGRYARGGANFTFQRGPNGVNYAIGGEVSIDTSVPSDPEQALAKANTVRAAALAPANPSSQDRIVASQAAQMAAQARIEITSEKAEEAANALEEKENAEEGESEESETEVTQQAQGEIQEYLDNTSAEDAANGENHVPLLNAEA